jgi:hypothetical protein
VRNAESTLAQTVQRTLEIASDLTDRFELVVVDDGSTDATSEVADELAHQYPQVRIARHGQPRGVDQAVRTGLRLSSGQVVLCRDPNAGEGLEDLSKTWRALKLGTLPAPKANVGYRLVDRRGGQVLPATELHGPSRPTRPAYVRRLGEFALGE